MNYFSYLDYCLDIIEEEGLKESPDFKHAYEDVPTCCSSDDCGGE